MSMVERSGVLTRSAIKKMQHEHLVQNGHSTAQFVKAAHWRELYDHKTCRVQSRPAGAPAGVWPHTPWWHCVFHDKYERINFWSHCVPGMAFLLVSVLCSAALLPGGAALAVFCACTAVTHMMSAITHVYPDSHLLEKCDHLGIVATIIGTPVTALMALENGHIPTPLAYICGALVCSAFLRPLPRVLGFVGCGAVMVVMYGQRVISPLFAVEIVLYLSGALFFLLNGGHHRADGFADHHLLHYFVTVAGALHVYYILDAQSIIA